MWTRQQAVDFAKSYDGAKQGSKKHKQIVNKFNALKIAGEVATYGCAWCAIFASVIMSSAGFTKKNAPMDWNTETIITKAKKLKVWIEADNTIPVVGMFVLYDWDDSGKGDNKGISDHIGFVISVDKKNKTFKAQEGNKGTTETCAVRKMDFNGRYIRGFVDLKGWAEKKSKPKTEPKPAEPKPTNIGKSYKIIEPIGLNIRSKASTKGEVLGAIPKGKTVTCLDESGDWIKIKYKYTYKKADGKKTSKTTTGWICTKENGVVYAKVV